MAFENVGNGILGRNKYKKDGDSKPEYDGKLTLTLDGQEREVRLAAWVREKDGRKFFSLAASVDINDAPPASQASVSDDDVPF